MITFEFDINKSMTNREKHGIDFNEAQRLWDDLWLIDIPVITTDEPRNLSIGKINGQYWTAVTTPRDNNIRMISVRRSRKTEEAIYEEYNSKRV